jgi:hypothetical protein
MEKQALEAGHAICTLTSTMTAHGFYLACGYQDTGAQVRSFGSKPAFPCGGPLHDAHERRREKLRPAGPPATSSVPHNGLFAQLS